MMNENVHKNVKIAIFYIFNGMFYEVDCGVMINMLEM